MIDILSGLVGKKIKSNISDIIASFGDKNDNGPFPFFIVDLQQIQANYQIFSEYFPHYPVHFALKSNSNLELLKSLNGINANFEIASIGELSRLLSIDVPPNRIICSNPCLSRDDITNMHQNGIRYFAFENVEKLKQLIKNAPNSRYILRINLNDTRFINYGASLHYIENEISGNRELCDRITGLTYYGDHDLGLSLCEKVIDLFLPHIKTVNLGGGYLNDGLMTEMNNQKKTGKFDFFVHKLKQWEVKLNVSFMMEPGGILTANTCHGVSRVKYVNSSNNGKIYYHIDLGPTLGLRKKPTSVYCLKKRARQTQEAYIVDATCAKNFICKADHCPPLYEDDILIFPNNGMYSTMYISDFHLLKKPQMVYV